MPFDLFVTRAPTFEEAAGEPPAASGLLSRMFGKGAPATARPITVEELHAVMKDALATPVGDAAYRVRHPKEGDPWCVIAWHTPGRLVLSTSYSNHRFLRNAVDMVYQGVTIARALEARLFEEAGGREVTEKNVDELMDFKGQYLALQVATFKNVNERIQTKLMAPFDYPAGPIDLATEFLIFFLTPERTSALDAVAQLVEREVPGTKAEMNASANALLVSSAEDGKWLAKVLLRDDGPWQIWPAHGKAPFARTAPAVVHCAESLARAHGGRLELRGRPYDDALRTEVHARMTGLAVDFFAWTQSMK
jgi:hypothetical protein